MFSGSSPPAAAATPRWTPTRNSSELVSFPPVIATLFLLSIVEAKSPPCGWVAIKEREGVSTRLRNYRWWWSGLYKIVTPLGYTLDVRNFQDVRFRFQSFQSTSSLRFRIDRFELVVETFLIKIKKDHLEVASRPCPTPFFPLSLSFRTNF